MRYARLALALAAPLLLVSCFLSPGKFVSTLDIRKDRSFTFTYVGEIISAEPKTTSGTGSSTGSGTDAQPSKPAAPTAETIAQRKAVAEALSKEEGYRSVEYLGGDRFRVDYSVSGRLDRGFVYPINLDAMAFIPWIVAEVRKDGTVRVKAPGFGDPSEQLGSGTPSEPAEGRQGTFTLTTDATLVMQNNEEGAAAGAPGSRIVWHITPTTKSVPTAVVRF
ncbi:MAG: hypothetical protein JWO81_753 [Alphaproteobacteria bacterium]|nr:hypothetical protein [Alphaproteobacteria bacterium]